MFEQAIEKAAYFTRPIHTISRTYDSIEVEPGCATLFFVNVDGGALTCKHVAKLIFEADAINEHYKNFKIEMATLIKTQKKRTVLPVLEKKYGYTKKHTIEIKNNFVNCITGNLELKKIDHSDADLSLLKFSNYAQLQCTQFPVFPKNTNSLVQGKMLCRLGFPFPEFENFIYNAAKDEIEWTATGRQATPRFPLDGMVTRHITGNLNGAPGVIGFEMSTPGLKGQSGGPAFDADGRVWGMQSATNHLYLGFDVEKKIKKDGKKTKISDSAFLHVGHIVYIDVIKNFMRQNNVQFQEA